MLSTPRSTGQTRDGLPGRPREKRRKTPKGKTSLYRRAGQKAMSLRASVSREKGCSLRGLGFRPVTPSTPKHCPGVLTLEGDGKGLQEALHLDRTRLTRSPPSLDGRRSPASAACFGHQRNELEPLGRCTSPGCQGGVASGLHSPQQVLHQGPWAQQGAGLMPDVTAK